MKKLNINLLSLWIAAFSLMLLFSCEKKDISESDDDSKTVHVTGVVLNEKEISIQIGSSFILKAAVVPENASDKDVFWTSSDFEIATVNQEGLVNAMKIGTATISVTTKDGEFTEECKVTVIEKDNIPVTGISLNTKDLTIHIGENKVLTSKITPQNATNKNLTWSSSKESIARVFDDGTVIGVGTGESIITVTTEDGGYTAECLITVLEEGEKLPDYIDEYGINQGPGIRIGNSIWAPVNCGFKAHTKDDKGYPYGKLYQWGRKDGHGYDENDASTYISDNGVLPENIDLADPEKFYWHWDDKIAPDGTWGGEDGKTKTKYDPCPDGWRVPTRDELDGLKGNAIDHEAGSTWRRGDLDDTPMSQYGRWYGTNHVYATASNPQGCLFLPASGMIVWGRACDREYVGQYWSSQNTTIYDYHCECLHFFESIEIFMHSKPRDIAISVRCIKE